MIFRKNALPAFLSFAISASAAGPAGEGRDGQVPTSPLPNLRFYAPLDNHARGVLLPYRAGIAADGVVGKACRVRPPAGLEFPLAPMLSSEQGSVAVWLRIDWAPAKPTEVRCLIDLGRFARLYQWKGQEYLTFALWYHHIDEKHDYSCTAPMHGWQPGQWHHVVLTWSWPERRRALYLDGRLAKSAPIRRRPNVISMFRIGPDVAAADELAVFARPLNAEEAADLFARGRSARPLLEKVDIPPARGAIEQLPDVDAPRPPAFVRWDTDGAAYTSNASVSLITLAGWWRWQRGRSPYEPPQPDRWLYRKAPAQSHFAPAFPVRDREFRIVPESDPRVGVRFLHGLPQWYEREFTPPAHWKSDFSHVVIEFDSVIGAGAVWLNEELVHVFPEINLGAGVDVSDRVVWGKPNRVTVLSKGMVGDVRIRYERPSPRIESAWVDGSWKERVLRVRLVVYSRDKLQVGVVLDAVDRSFPEGAANRRVFTVGPGRTALDFEMPAGSLEPWSMTRPVLHTMRLALTAPGRKTAYYYDTLPFPVGLRDIEVKGGDFLLNGKPLQFIGHSNAHLTTAAELSDPAYIRYSLERWRDAGVNLVTPWVGRQSIPSLHRLLDIADEIGFGVMPVVNLPSGEREAETPERRERWNTLFRQFIERYRQHPSLLGWIVGTSGHVYDFCPAVLDGRFTPDIPAAAPLRRTWDYIRGVDPTRPVFGLSSGNLGMVWTSMAYLGFDVDLQERENWPLRWSLTRRKPLMPCEFSLPYYRNWFARPRTRVHHAQYRPPKTRSLATEYGAMLLGPKAYAIEPDDYLDSLSTSPGQPARSRAYWEVKKLFADALRAWRAYGLSFVYHAEVPAFFDGAAPRFPSAADADPRRWGATPENLHGSLQARNGFSPFGRRVRDATAPLMAFIGGPDGAFTRKDHAYLAGREVRKALALVNATERDRQFTATWEIVRVGSEEAARPSGPMEGIRNDSNATARPSGPQTTLPLRQPPVRQGKLRWAVPAGGRETTRAVIRFRAPDVRRRTDYELRVRVRCDPEADGRRERLSQPPVFRFAVFPPIRAAPVPPNLHLFDPVGDTKAALDRLGVHIRPMPQRLGPDIRLVVGRHALERPEYRRQLESAGFDQAVLDGLRVLIFEQAVPNWEGTLMGLRFKRIETRRAFVRCPTHPALDGLTESDFEFMKGESNLIPAYPGPGPMPKQYPVHFWHWGNDNMVATYTVEKPQIGAARAVLDAGFDLAESALLEVARDRGLLLFCQVDVTNRVGRDPVSTRLVRNLLAYITSDAAQRPPAAPPLAELLQRVPPTARFEGFRSEAPDVPGIHDGEVFFREKLRLPAFDAKPPLFASVRLGDRTVWITSLTGIPLRTPWQEAKRARIEAALRFHNGERTAAGPRVSDGSAARSLYPFNWQRLSGWDADFDPYVFWRW